MYFWEQHLWLKWAFTFGSSWHFRAGTANKSVLSVKATVDEGLWLSCSVIVFCEKDQLNVVQHKFDPIF